MHFLAIRTPWAAGGIAPLATVALFNYSTIQLFNLSAPPATRHKPTVVLCVTINRSLLLVALLNGYLATTYIKEIIVYHQAVGRHPLDVPKR